MDAQELRNLQEAYMEVVSNDLNEMPAYRNAAKKGYDAPPLVAAEAIMVNMSEEWRQSILG